MCFGRDLFILSVLAVSADTTDQPGLETGRKYIMWHIGEYGFKDEAAPYDNSFQPYGSIWIEKPDGTPRNYSTTWLIVANGVKPLVWDLSWANWATNAWHQFARHSLRKPILRQALEMLAGVRFELTTFGL
jgi:hypothetical protein